MQHLQELVRQHGLGKATPASADTSEHPSPLPPADTVDDCQNTTGNPEPEPDPGAGDVFRQRLNTILKDAVGRLESLADEVYRRIMMRMTLRSAPLSSRRSGQQFAQLNQGIIRDASLDGDAARRHSHLPFLDLGVVDHGQIG